MSVRVRVGRSGRRACRTGVAIVVLLGIASAASAYEVGYEIGILPDRGVARVRVAIEQSGPELVELSFALVPDRLFDESATGELSRWTGEDGERRLVWRVPEQGGSLEYSMRIDHVRDPAEYDARCTPTWMVARGEDLVPGVASRWTNGAPADGATTLRFKLPPDWRVAHAYPERDGAAIIRQEGRRLERPTGWIVAGRIDLIESDENGMRVLLAAPRAHEVDLRDRLAFLRFTLPSLADAFGTLPDRMLVASADDPMWRGGLSAPNSVYLHADRPLVEDDLSSPLLHELVHLVTRARSAPGDDWIVEGIAEFYARELLRRTGAISDQEYERSQAELADEAAKVERLEGESTGAETALAVTFFAQLDRRIRAESDGERSLDDLARSLSGEPEPIGRRELLERIRRHTGFDATDLMNELIPGSPVTPDEAAGEGGASDAAPAADTATGDAQTGKEAGEETAEEGHEDVGPSASAPRRGGAVRRTFDAVRAVHPASRGMGLAPLVQRSGGLGSPRRPTVTKPWPEHPPGRPESRPPRRDAA